MESNEEQMNAKEQVRQEKWKRKIEALKRELLRKRARAKAWAKAHPEDPLSAVILTDGREAKLRAAKEAVRAICATGRTP
jgi:hypothetical protein